MSSVDFPDPDGPIIDTKSPFSTEKLSWLNTLVLTVFVV
uniref:Uncharacterized protein n=1 Tax=Yersinia enterocolitica W22703 TaxID=913028 RepID=F4MY66_YEREN|nr:unknown protein [Yersinia enterocolitica W22703]